MKGQAKQLYKEITLTERKCINSIIRFYHLATVSELKEGIGWYIEANNYCRELASRYDLSIQQTAGIIAVFSPQAGWVENKRYALSFLLNPKNRLRSLTQDIKARKIVRLKSETDIYNVLSTNGTAWKTKAFYLNMLNPDVITSVTIDRHAIAICIQEPNNVYALEARYSKLTAKQYNFFEQCYMKAAAKLNILPQQLQAITWTVYRRLRDLREHSNVNEWTPFITGEDPF